MRVFPSPRGLLFPRLPGLALLVLLALGALAGVALAGNSELLPYNPVARREAQVISGKARFTVLTEQLIRIEWSESGRFEDRATIAVLHRNLEVPRFTQKTENGLLTLTTAKLSLSYRVGAAFNSDNLQAQVAGFQTPWKFGKHSEGNLLGTIRTLDGVAVTTLDCRFNQGPEEDQHCEWGLISRDGWHAVDDSKNWVLDPVTDWWLMENPNTVDSYLFGHGWDYKAAIRDYNIIGGRVAMTPRYMVGALYTRWFDFSAQDVKRVVEDHEHRRIPLSVFIYDMNWHVKHAWGSYTWDRRLYPFPEETNAWLHSKGLATSVNVHDASGVWEYEDKHAEMAQALGLDPKDAGILQYNLVDSRWAYALEDTVWRHVENSGIDFCWIDWQQGEDGAGTHGKKQNPTIWSNKMRATNPIRRKEKLRGAVLGRWGGLGNHRYQVGFSGDVNGLTWDNLAFQPYFSMTAANVLYSFWSHDIVGPADDHELHIRWLQWGAYSGNFRIHDRGMTGGGCANDNPPSCGIVDIWKLPQDHYEAGKEAMVQREELMPYIYTQGVRQAFDTGLGLLRPLYYDFPELDMAYKADKEGNFAQYMFGNDILVAPVVRPMNRETLLAEKDIWLPPGDWVEMNQWALLSTEKGETVKRFFELQEIPRFARAGAIIPTLPIRNPSLTPSTLGAGTRQYEHLVFTVVPFPRSFSITGRHQNLTQVYEDDGMTTGYLEPKGNSAWTTASYEATNGPDSFKLKFEIVTEGSYKELPVQRAYTLRLPATMAPSEVLVNGRALPLERYAEPAAGYWRYDGSELATVIVTPVVRLAQKTIIQLTSARLDQLALHTGAVGALKRGQWAKLLMDQDRRTPGSQNPVDHAVLELSSIGEELEILAQKDLQAFNQRILVVPTLLRQAVEETRSLLPPPAGSLFQRWHEDRRDSLLCASPACHQTNWYYTQMRVEGWQANANQNDAIKLNPYWRPAQNDWDQWHNDHWVTTDPQVPAGYTFAAFEGGWVLRKDSLLVRSLLEQAAQTGEQPAVLPLQLWFSEDHKDHLTVASAAGIQWAKEMRYKLVDPVLGYVYRERQEFHLQQHVDAETRVRAALKLYDTALMSAAPGFTLKTQA